jgi:putative transposase
MFYLPGCCPTLNPVQGLCSVLERCLADLAPHRADALAVLVRTRLRCMRYRTGALLDGLIAHSGLSLEPP